MQPFDIVLLAYLAFGALRGWGRGLLAMAAGIAGFLLAIVVARLLYAPLASYLDLHWHLQQAIQSALSGVTPVGPLLAGGLPAALHVTAGAVVAAIAFLAILLVAELVLGGVAGVLGRLPNHLPLIGPLNRLAGAALGAAESAAVAAAVLLLLEPLARSGSLGSLSAYVVHAPWATQLWHLALRLVPDASWLP